MTTFTELQAQMTGPGGPFETQTEVIEIVYDLAERNATVWANDKVEAPPKLAAEVVDLLVDLRLARRSDDHDCWLTLLPAAARFFVDPDLVTGVQERLL